MIYYVSVKTKEVFHQQAMGFSNLWLMYVWSDCPANAELKAKEVVSNANLTFDSFAGTAKRAVHQDLKTYSFPEQIYGLPFDLFMVEMKRRMSAWGEEMVQDSVNKYHRLQSGVVTHF